MQEIVKKVYGAGKGNLEDKARVGGSITPRHHYAIMIVEAIRAAQNHFGKGSDVARAGALGPRASRLERSAVEGARASGLFPPVKTSCADHEGSGMVKFEQWDGKEFAADAFHGGRPRADQKMVEEGAAKYATKKK